MPSRRCPCGSGLPLTECCGRLHDGTATAATAEQLMRSRYSAFVLRDAGYLLDTWHPSTRPAALDLDRGVRWTGLDVLATTGGSLLAAEGTVESGPPTCTGARRAHSTRTAGSSATAAGGATSTASPCPDVTHRVISTTTFPRACPPVRYATAAGCLGEREDPVDRRRHLARLDEPGEDGEVGGVLTGDEEAQRLADERRHRRGPQLTTEPQPASAALAADDDQPTARRQDLAELAERPVPTDVEDDVVASATDLETSPTA